MNTISAVELCDYSVVRIAGADRREFLQGQLTQDIGEATPQQSVATGWTNAKGRLLCVGQLIDWHDAFYLPLPRDIAEGVARRLKMFVLRAKVTIDSPELGIAGLTGRAGEAIGVGALELPPESGAVRASAERCVARVAGDPQRAWVIGAVPAADFQMTEPVEWQRSNIRAGLPEITAGSSELFTPQMLNLDLLGAISFTKGCYVGQEIVARTQNLGRIKRRMYRFRVESTEPFHPGQLLYGPDDLTGKIVSCASDDTATEILAVIAIKSADDEWFTDAKRSIPVTRQPLPYTIGG
jgi:folate-binding protein YgfZ